MTTQAPNLIYCLKCRTKTESKDLEEVTTKNGKAATRGICSVCGTKTFRINGNKK